MFLTEQLIRHEGLRLKLYKCPAGKISIGVGRNIQDRGITRSEAMYMLAHDIASATVDLKRVMAAYHIPEWMVSPPRKDALINVAFNIGRRSLIGFRKMWGAIHAENWDEAAKELLDSKYASDVGDRAVELAEQIRTGVYHNPGKDGRRGK